MQYPAANRPIGKALGQGSPRSFLRFASCVDSLRANPGGTPAYADQTRELFMFVTPAYAQAAGATSGAAGLASFIPLILVFVIMYFLMIRPQQKRMKEHRAMVEAVKKGDEIVTQGGLIGKVAAVREGEVEVEIAPGVKVRVVRATISSVVNRTAPAAANN